MVEEQQDLDLVVEGRGTIEGQEPGFFDDGDKESAELALDSADEVPEAGPQHRSLS